MVADRVGESANFFSGSVSGFTHSNSEGRWLVRDSAAIHLERAAGMLRAEVAPAICRKHAPELLFDVRL